MFQKRNAFALLALGAVSVLVRLVVWNSYRVATTTDSFAYLHVATLFKAGRIRGYDGIRAPGYPLLIAAARARPNAVWLLQSLLGVAASYLMFCAGYRHTGRRVPALLLGLYPTLNLALLSYEPLLLSEALATFLVTLSLTLLGYFHDCLPSRRMWAALSLGVVWAALVLTRPLFLFGIVLLPILLLSERHADLIPLPRRWGPAALMFTSALVLVVSWSAVIYIEAGSFSPSTLSGLEITNHSGRIMEKAPDRYEVLRDIYLAYRPGQVAQTGSYVDTIWHAYPEMLRDAKLRPGQLSNRLLAMSVVVLASNPASYTYTVSRSFLDFWVPNARWYRSHFVNASMRRVVLDLLPPERILIFALYLVFAVVTLELLIRLGRRRLDSKTRVELFVGSIVVAGSIFQALAGYGASSRYAIPFQPLIAYVALMGMWGATHRSRA